MSSVIKRAGRALILSAVGILGSMAAASAQSPLEGLANQSSTITSSLKCRASSTAVTGIPAINGRDQLTYFAVQLDRSGAFVMNGRVIPPVDAKIDNGTASMSMVRLQDFLAAVSGIDASTGSAMGLSKNDSDALAAMMNGFINQGVGSRQRYAVYDGVNGRVLFADAAGKEFKNLRVAECYRVGGPSTMPKPVSPPTASSPAKPPAQEWSFTAGHEDSGRTCVVSAMWGSVTVGFLATPRQHIIAYLHDDGLPKKVASTWKVDDFAAHRLLGEFDAYFEWHSFAKPPAELLRQAAIGKALTVMSAGRQTMRLPLDGAQTAFESFWDCYNSAENGVATVQPQLSPSGPSTIPTASDVLGKARQLIDGLGTPLSADAIHSICRTAQDDTDFRSVAYQVLTGRQVDISLKAVSYSASRKVLGGESTVRQGAYVGTIVIEIDTSQAKIDGPVSQSSVLQVKGIMASDNVLYANKIDNCFITLKASSVTRDGF